MHTKPSEVARRPILNGDARLIVLARLGFSYRVLQEQTGSSRGHVAVVLRRYGIKLFDYRDGQTSLSKRVIGLASQKVSLAGIKQQLLLEVGA